MATNRVLQLLRSNTLYVPTGEGADAKTAKQNAKDAVIKLPGRKDGEMLLARYQETGADIKSLLCIYHANPDLKAEIAEGAAKHWTFIEDASSSEGSSAALRTEVNAIESSVGLGNDGTYQQPSGTNYLNDTATVMGALGTLDTQVKNVNDRIDNLNKTADVQNGQVVTTVTQVDGLVSETKANVIDLQLGGYSKEANATLPIAAADTVNAAFSKVENAIAKNTVSSTDKTIKINTTGATTDLSVNIDGKTIVAANDGTLSTALKVVKVIPSGTAGADEVVDNSLPANVKEAYRLVYEGSNTAIGKQIEVYKDSSLKSVQLGNPEDTIDANGDIVPAQSPSPETAGQSLNFVYHLADETYQLVQVDVSKFLTESEYGDGLSVSNTGVISVKYGDGLGFSSTADTDGKKKLEVVIDKSNDTHNYLSVGVDGVALNGDAIDTAISNAATASATQITEKNTSATADTNDKYIKVVKTTGTNGDPDSYLVTTTGIDTAITNAIEALDGSATATADSGDVYTVLTGVSQTDGVISKASEVTLAAVAKTGAAADVSYDNTTARMADSPATVQAAIDKLDSRIDALGTDALESVTSTNGAIVVGDKDNHTQSLTFTLDGTTQGNGHENTGTDNALTITDYGLFLSTTWDCGVY